MIFYPQESKIGEYNVLKAKEQSFKENLDCELNEFVWRLPVS
jgi:hypothetical protein